MEEQGTGFARYSVIPRTLTFIFCKDEVLLIKGSPNKRIWAGRYNGIGGHVEQGEDLLTSAKRELMEETGIKEVDLEYCGQIQVDTGENPGVSVHIFKGEFIPTVLHNSQEGILEWVPLEEVRNLPLVKDLYQILPAVNDWHIGRPIIFGLTSYKSGEMETTLTDTFLRS